MNLTNQKKAAKEFAERWEGKGYEKGESQLFWIDLLEHVYGIENAAEYIICEEQVKLDKANGFIDVMIPSTHVMVEQKSIGKSLSNAIKQSDGSMLSPFQQAKRYSAELPYSQRPRYIITCNFAEFYIYDMEKPHGEPEILLLKDLPKEYYRLNFLVKEGDEHLQREMEISIKAGDLVGKIYDMLRLQYANPDSIESLKSLNILCVRLVFCMYAEDADIFERNSFGDFLKDLPAQKIRKNLRELFQVLDTPSSERDKYLEEELAAFPYVNGGLFAEENIEIPMFTDEIKDVLINEMCAFDWKDISPTIFGAIFESTLNPETRRSGGMHYTSIENIHKVIDPLFFDDLREEFQRIAALKDKKDRNRKLEEFRHHLSTLNFLDPACGSGNFLTETYMSLRKLENECLSIIQEGEATFFGSTSIEVSINQFYGIEINDFAVSVAKTALWIAEHKMLLDTERITMVNLDFLPLKTYKNIVEGNALKVNWDEVISKDELSYIIGNPPFVGASMMTKEQKDESTKIFGKIKLSNSIDYVGGWYFKACEMIKETNVKVALVSTNSITQGEQVAPLWGTLFEKYNIHIDFAHRTFRWDSEANLKAHVHCVIIGFSSCESGKYKIIYDNSISKKVDNINGYLIDAPNVCIESRSKPVCEVCKMTKGNQPTDDGNFILNEEECSNLLSKNKELDVCIRRYVGAKDYLNNNEIRYCLWLKGISPNIYKKNAEINKRLLAIKEFREQSTAAPTRKFAEKPYLFFSSPQTDEPYLIIPRVSSERRKYIPIGFMPPEIIAADSLSIICGASLYDFGILISNVHMAWMRTVCGRLKSDYRYSGQVVYNNFPWCYPTLEQKLAIEKTAQAILDARAMYPDCSLADLYDELTMPVELRKAHQANDKAVMQAYGFWGKLNSESECVAELMKMYQKLTTK